MSFREVPHGFRRRLQLITLAAMVGFLFLGGRLWQLQVEQGSDFREAADHNRIRLKRVRPTRGLIFDRRGAVLVENRPSYDVVIVPEDAGDPRAVLRRLGDYLGSAGDDLPDPDAKDERSPFEPLLLMSDIDWDALVVVETRKPELPGVSLRVGPRRSYPYGPIAAHLLGYVGQVAPSDLSDARYHRGDTIGKYGLERLLEDDLRGVNGGQQIEVDVHGRETRVIREVAEQPGAAIHLTIDIDLQQAAHRALEGREGAIVAMDPRDGALLAMVSRPGFDPNLFARGVSTEQWADISENPLRPLSDRARQGLYPPGSVFKIVTAAAALEENVVNESTAIYCPGMIQYGSGRFRCWKRSGHGWMNLRGAMAESCDVYFYEVAQRLTVDGIAAYALRFGLGNPTGVELDGEQSGLIPTSSWKRRRFGEPWYKGETLPVAIGQGYVTTTPVQLASLIATIAAGGVRHAIHLVDHIEHADGRISRPVRPEPASVGLRPDTVRQIRSGLVEAIVHERGTGRLAALDDVTIAGKTGTSQTARIRHRAPRREHTPRRLRDHAWFVAYAPVNDPQIAVSVLIEHAGEGGGKVAAPIAREVLEHYFHRRDPQDEDADRPTTIAAR